MYMYIYMCMYVYVYMYISTCMYTHASNIMPGAPQSIPKHANTASMHMHMYTKMQTHADTCFKHMAAGNTKILKTCQNLHRSAWPGWALDPSMKLSLSLPLEDLVTAVPHQLTKLAPGHTRLKPLSLLEKLLAKIPMLVGLP